VAFLHIANINTILFPKVHILADAEFYSAKIADVTCNMTLKDKWIYHLILNDMAPHIDK
jgi:hypothetical protein